MEVCFLFIYFPCIKHLLCHLVVRQSALGWTQGRFHIILCWPLCVVRECLGWKLLQLEWMSTFWCELPEKRLTASSWTYQKQLLVAILPPQGDCLRRKPLQKKLVQEQRESNEILLTELRPHSKSVGKPHFLPERLSINMSIDDLFNCVSLSDPPPNSFWSMLVWVGFSMAYNRKSPTTGYEFLGLLNNSNLQFLPLLNRDNNLCVVQTDDCGLGSIMYSLWSKRY